MMQEYKLSRSEKFVRLSIVILSKRTTKTKELSFLINTMTLIEERRNRESLLVVLGFKATLIAKVISWRSVTHMCFLAFSHQY